MEKINYFNIGFFLVFFNIFSVVKNDYVTFDLKTYKNNSDYYDEYEKYFFDHLYNMLYSEISLGPNKQKMIMEIKVDTLYFSIYNHNCEIPPVDNTQTSSYLDNFANSTILKDIKNSIPFDGEYFLTLLENTIDVKTNNGQKTTKINYLFSRRNDTDYTQYLVLRPYTCFRLGFDIPFNSPSDITPNNNLALNLAIQFKKNNITSSYKWFIEYDSNNNEQGKLILGSTPHDYNPKKYKEENSKTINTKIRMDSTFHWDIEVNQIYVKNSTGTYLDTDINSYLSCSLEPSLGVIFGSNGYKLFIEENLFSKLRKDKQCYISNPLILNKYITYYCKKDIKEYLKEHFHSIIFLHRYFNKSFELNYDDVFEEKGEYIYFKIFFDKYVPDLWRFGKPFLSKYFFSYDIDNRLIIFYDKVGSDESNNGNENNGDNKGDKSNNNIILICVIIVLIIIFGVVGFFIAKYIYTYQKRRKGTELEDTYGYNYGSLNNDNE